MRSRLSKSDSFFYASLVSFLKSGTKVMISRGNIDESKEHDEVINIDGFMVLERGDIRGNYWLN